jgi:hypothetical protein
MRSQGSEIADPILYRTYYSLMMGDILLRLGVSPTKKAKDQLHDFHKRMFGYKTIAGQPHEAVSHFLFCVTVFWATEFGFFIRTNGRQPYDIESKPLSECWNLL